MSQTIIFSTVSNPDRWESDPELTPAVCKRIRALALWYRQKTGHGIKAIKIGSDGSLWGSPLLPRKEDS